MKLLLVCGGMQEIVMQRLPRGCAVLNERPMTAESALVLLEEAHLTPDLVLVTDGGIPQDAPSRLTLIRALCRQAQSANFRILLFTNHLTLEQELKRESGMLQVLEIVRFETVRLPHRLIENTLARPDLPPKRKPSRTEPREAAEPSRSAGHPARQSGHAPPSAGSLWSRLFGKSRRDDDDRESGTLARHFEGISRSIHKVVAITGHRGSGITSTAVNLAWEANRRGLSTMLIDMDVDYRSLNMYFSSFHDQARQDADLQASLIRLLARPSDYELAAWHLKGELWLSSLGYGYDDPKQFDQLFTADRLTALLSVLRSRFRLLILDMPMDLLGRFRESFHQIDVFGVCVPNNLNGIVNLARNAELVLDADSARHVNAKAKLIVTRYNEFSRLKGEMFTPDKVREVLASGLSACFPYEMKVAGYVPYSSDFDSQIERDLPIAGTRKEFEHAYGQILLRLMESA